ncbi:MAG: glycoside hydrolase family 127 protein [Oscillospiraceae bacterium]|nr:glycoside hydrolase family 127 protein [Oscillospiraceae bacterium]
MLDLKACSEAYRTIYGPRLQTDQLFISLPNLAQLRGRLDQAIRQTEACQLKDRDLWPLFVRQFSLHSDDPDQGWRGEYWGKMMRGACFTLAYTRDAELAAIMETSVRELLACQDEAGRITTYSRSQEFQGWDIWNRKYVMLGLLYYYPLCQDQSLKQEIELSLRRQADYLLTRIGPVEQGLLPITATSDYWQGMNASSILEPFVLLYNLTQEPRYLDFATYIVESGGISGGDLFKLALDGKRYPYQYPVTKAYEMMSCFEGLLEYYRVTDKASCRQAVENFARLVLSSDITVIGCAGCTHELFDHSAVTQTDPERNRRTHMQETCVTVTWMKLCLQLLTLTGQAVWGDALEQSIYNALLGAMNDQHETCSVDRSLAGYHLEAAGLRPDSILLPFDSYSPLLANLRGKYVGGLKALQDGRFYGCCAAIGSAGTGLIPQAAVLLNDHGLSFNLYVAGQIKLDFADGIPVGP